MPVDTATDPDFSRVVVDAEPVEVFKRDGRSEVWRWDDDTGRAWVIKRFLHPPWKQRLSARLGRHPAQRERRWHERLAVAGVPVAEIAAGGVDSQGRHWLVTPSLGPSVYNWLRYCDAERDVEARHDFTRQLGRLTGQLLAMRVRHGDHKISNVVIHTTDDGTSQLHLIDAGACDGFKGTPLLGAALPMLLNLHRNVADAATYHDTPDAVKPTRADRLRFLKAMLEAWPSYPDGFQHLPRSKEFLEA